MLDHLSIQCADVAVSAAFGYGVPPRPDFWIGARTTGDGLRESHIAFAAPSPPAVDARLWPEYHPNYDGGFVGDPDGHNVEAVCHLAG